MNRNRAVTTKLNTVRGFKKSNAESVNSVMKQLEIQSNSVLDPLAYSTMSSNEDIYSQDMPLSDLTDLQTTIANSTVHGGITMYPTL